MKHQFKTLLLVSLLLVAGCNDTPLVEEESNNTQRTFTLSASMPGSGDHATRVAGEQDPASLDIVLKWKTGDEIQLYFKVGNTITLGDKVEVQSISSDEKTAQFVVNVPPNILGNFDLYGVHGTSSEIDGSAILLDVAPDNFVKLEDARVPLYFIKEDFDVDSPVQTVTFKHLGALQVITIKNITYQKITLKNPFLDFSNDDKWYYDASVNGYPRYNIVSGDTTMVTGASSAPGSSISVDINANDSIKLAQWVMPNKFQPPAIYIKAEIGETLRTTGSKGPRNLALETGKAYHLNVLWNGANLSFAEEVYKITMSTSVSQLKLKINADPEDQDDVWIDLDNNGVRDNDDEVKSFGNEHDYVAASQVVTIYGKVTSLVCSQDSLTALEVSNNTMLTSLYCNNNKLSALNVSNNKELTHLHCNNNELSALNVSNNKELTHLYCYNNKLTALGVSGANALIIMHCHTNSLSELDVSQNTALTNLHCYSNKLTELDVSKNTALTHLYCHKNELTSLSVFNNTVLEHLKCSYNFLTALDVSQNEMLVYLYCHNNTIKDIVNDTINDTAMTDLLRSLPPRNRGDEGTLYLINIQSDGNECNQDQKKIATDKNWKVLKSSGGEYNP